MKRFAALSGVLLVTLVTGCLNELRDDFTECKIKFSNMLAAKSAYRDIEGACDGICCPHSFKEGFIAGYVAVADGGLGCPPAVPQIRFCNHMWLDMCSDSEKMEAWYDGYEQGVVAAKAEGMGDVNRVNTRMPHGTPVDYSNSGHAHSTGPMGSPPPADSSVPPQPVAPPEVLGGPQTSRPVQEIFE